MTTYTVHLVQTVSTAVTVDAEDQDSAVEAAWDRAPSPTNSTNHGIDPSGAWEEVFVVNDETGEEVWSDYPQDAANELRRENEQLRKRVAELEAMEQRARATLGTDDALVAMIDELQPVVLHALPRMPHDDKIARSVATAVAFHLENRGLIPAAIPAVDVQPCQTCGKPIPEGPRMAQRLYCSYSCSPAFRRAYEEG